MIFRCVGERIDSPLRDLDPVADSHLLLEVVTQGGDIGDFSHGVAMHRTSSAAMPRWYYRDRGSQIAWACPDGLQWVMAAQILASVRSKE